MQRLVAADYVDIAVPTPKKKQMQLIMRKHLLKRNHHLWLYIKEGI
uniref:Uncharacterized protein n=1 Tax=Arundo donax TaxID=35708 RepID=A0A0A9AF04_ARUDO